MFYTSYTPSAIRRSLWSLTPTSLLPITLSFLIVLVQYICTCSAITSQLSPPQWFTKSSHLCVTDIKMEPALCSQSRNQSEFWPPEISGSMVNTTIRRHSYHFVLWITVNPFQWRASKGMIKNQVKVSPIKKTWSCLQLLQQVTKISDAIRWISKFFVPNNERSE